MTTTTPEIIDLTMVSDSEDEEKNLLNMDVDFTPDEGALSIASFIEITGIEDPLVPLPVGEYDLWTRKQK